jgi:hypothetical protein
MTKGIIEIKINKALALASIVYTQINTPMSNNMIIISPLLSCFFIYFFLAFACKSKTHAKYALRQLDLRAASARGIALHCIRVHRSFSSVAFSPRLQPVGETDSEASTASGEAAEGCVVS